MYLEHFGLDRKPFSKTPDPEFLFHSRQHAEALARLSHALEEREVAVLTGEVGTGKTTLLHALLSQLDASTASAFVFNPRLDPLDFFRVLFDEYGIETPCRTKGEYLLALNHFLIQRLERDETTLLIVDEAQNLSPEMLEEIRLLSNLETPRSKLLQIMLVGQPELNDLLGRAELRQLRQRIVLRHHLRPFDEKETVAYVEERLRLAGYTGKGVFDRGALRELFAVTRGVPRLVNIVCDGALLLAYSRASDTVGRGTIREVATDLGLAPAQAGRAGGVSGATSRPRRRLFGLFR